MMGDDDTNWLPILVRSNVTEWERNFLASLIAQTRAGRRLSAKQATTLRRIKSDFQAASLREDSIIEGGDDHA
jgi:hypothetical protein